MNQKHLKKVRRNDRLARWIITISGVAVIIAVIAILFLIAGVAFPLFKKPKAESLSSFTLSNPASPVLALGIDEYMETCFTLTDDGDVVFYDAIEGTELDRVALKRPSDANARIIDVETRGDLRFSLLWDDGSVTLDTVRFKPVFDDKGVRTITHRVSRLGTLEPNTTGKALRTTQLRQNEEGSLIASVISKDDDIFLRWVTIEEDLFGNETKEAADLVVEDPLPGKLTAVTLDSEGSHLYAGTDNGYLLRWDLRDAGEAQLMDRFRAFSDGRAITALGTVFGDESIAVGDATGGMSAWFPTPSSEESNKKKLTRVHVLKSHKAAVSSIYPTSRDKSLLSLSEQGVTHVDHMTSGRHLYSFSAAPSEDAPHGGAATSGFVRVALSKRGNSLIAVDPSGQVYIWAIHSPHPETSWKTLFGKVWYESYDKSEFVWQSSSSSDDFEPKLSVMPLIFGSIKGTLYAMLFAVPIALFGAVYTSQFAPDGIRKAVKPTVEIMAAIPSVVIGFLAALWFAPILESFIVAFFLSLLLIPAVMILYIVIWQQLRKSVLLKRVERGYEFLVAIPVVLIAILISTRMAPGVEEFMFDGNFQQWLFGDLGQRYDQRNCIVIAFALGFAVIPIIFTISEDALSNVPQSLKAASLAVGASRWQTVWRVVLPSASPGIFAGVIIGLGRAVGETMIVLMATGNTPIMDWSPFNGMRTLSANIAVEIPEAPVGGTLYRTLFLSAVVLFVMTFFLNTVADVVRMRLRNKYGRF